MRGLLASIGILIAVPVIAQQPVAADGGQLSAAEQAQMADYLCKLVNECGAQPDDGITPTKAAPGTRGFRLATAAGANPAAPAVRPQRFTRSAGARTGYMAGRQGSGSRYNGRSIGRYTAPVAAVAPGTVTSPPHADLMLSFTYNSAQLTRGAEGRARVFARTVMLPQLRDKRFLIEGHTDARGPRSLNMDLSRRRAQAVADFLVGQGVDRSRVQVTGVGPDQPLPGLSAASEANRRVEAVLVS